MRNAKTTHNNATQDALTPSSETACYCDAARASWGMNLALT